MNTIAILTKRKKLYKSVIYTQKSINYYSNTTQLFTKINVPTFNVY